MGSASVNAGHILGTCCPGTAPCCAHPSDCPAPKSLFALALPPSLVWVVTGGVVFESHSLRQHSVQFRAMALPADFFSQAPLSPKERAKQRGGPPVLDTPGALV